MDQIRLIDALERSTPSAQFETIGTTVDWLLSRGYLAKQVAAVARQALALAVREHAPELLLSVALLLVPPGWNGDVSFGKGLAHSVVFSPTFVAYGDEPPVEAEHEVPAVALAIAAVKARA